MYEFFQGTRHCLDAALLGLVDFEIRSVVISVLVPCFDYLLISLCALFVSELSHVSILVRLGESVKSLVFGANVDSLGLILSLCEILNVLNLAIGIARDLRAGEGTNTCLENVSRLIAPTWSFNQGLSVNLIHDGRNYMLDHLWIADLGQIELLLL